VGEEFDTVGRQEKIVYGFGSKARRKESLWRLWAVMEG
jgi:hypothetical protein